MDTEYRKAANITIIVAGIAVLLWLIFKHALGALLPFLLAAAVAAIVHPAAKKISARTKLPLKLVCALLLIAAIFTVVTLMYLAISRLLFELGSLLSRLSEDPEIIIDSIKRFTSAFTHDGGLGFLHKIFESEAFVELGIDMNEILQSALKSAVSALTSSLPSLAVGVVSSIPSIILFTVVFLISAFYFTTDKERIFSSLATLLPDRWQKKLPSLKSRLSRTLSGYLKAYLLIMFMTFLEVFVGLSVLGVNYAFILAVVIAIVDVLPVLGTGTVLIPWSVFAFVTGDIKLGIGLLILYGITLVARQFAEPKIVGNTLGIHPLATLASVYIGLELLGLVGLFAGPMVALLLTQASSKKSDRDKADTQSTT